MNYIYAVIVLPVLFHAYWNLSNRPATPKEIQSRILFEFYRWGWGMAGAGAISVLVTCLFKESNPILDTFTLLVPMGFSLVVLRSWLRAIFAEYGSKKDLTDSELDYEADETVVFHKK